MGTSCRGKGARRMLEAPSWKAAGRRTTPDGAVSAREAGLVRAGPKSPMPGTPQRASGSVRRTATIDSVRPEGWAGRVEVTARARDLLTRTDGTASTRAHERFTAVLSADRVLRAIEHADARLAALVGRPVAGGFRARALELLADEAGRGSLLNLLLDDLPGESLVAGYALQRDPQWPSRRVAAEHLSGMDDLCAGWARDATILQVVRAEGVIPVPTTAAVLPGNADDPDAWHELPPLPWTECPGALVSVARIAGTTTDDLRARVRTDFTGPSTCTHLNDVLRSLADLPVLTAHLLREPA